MAQRTEPGFAVDTEHPLRRGAPNDILFFPKSGQHPLNNRPPAVPNPAPQGAYASRW